MRPERLTWPEWSTWPIRPHVYAIILRHGHDNAATHKYDA